MFGNQQQQKAQANDFKFTTTPTDSISSISINGNTTTPPNCLVATSWDSTVSCYQISYGNAGVSAVNPQSQIKHDAPVLCSDFGPDQLTVFSGSCDGVVKMWNVSQGPQAAQNIGKHDKAVKNMKFIPEKNMLLTASWDGSLRSWDCRQPNPTGTFNLGDRACAMDACGEAVVVGTADRKIHVFSLTAGNQVAGFLSPMSFQTRTISMFHDQKGFAIGSIEGRIAIEYFDEMQAKDRDGKSTIPKGTGKNFAFKCHRDAAKTGVTSDIFAVHSIQFHPKNTFFSGGGDGCLSSWDKDARHRIAHLDLFSKKSAVTDMKIDKTGSLLFYSLSYDWSRGHHSYDPKMPNDIYVHVLQQAETDPKAATTGNKTPGSFR